jgi:dTMP kinase
MSGRFITVEGIEGAGKSTQLAVIRECLLRAGHAVIMTREPGGTALGEEIRSLLLAHWGWVSWSQAVSQGIELLPLLAFPEALMNGMAVTLMAVYRPQWLATFDEQRFLR